MRLPCQSEQGLNRFGKRLRVQSAPIGGFKYPAIRAKTGFSEGAAFLGADSGGSAVQNRMLVSKKNLSPPVTYLFL
jgi:hypothetical protein